jgi:hypothetical protein
MDMIQRVAMGLLLGLLAGGLAPTADAAHFKHCPDPSQLDRCYGLYLEEIQYPIPRDPGPYTPVDIGPIVSKLLGVLGAEPDPEPWFLIDMENAQLAILDLQGEVVYVPEPAEMMLLCSGVAGLAVFGRKRRT